MWRAVLSIVAAFGWLIFMVLWLFFYTSDLSSSQNLAILVVSLLILIAVLAIAWITWGIKYPRPSMPRGYGYYPPGPRARSIVGGLTGIAWLAFVIIWLFFFADDFTIYQNIGALAASALIAFGAGWALSLVFK